MRMRAGWVRRVAGAAVGMALLAGCAAEADKPPPVPMATDSPNQVVVLVPGMVCESCTEHVTEGLAMLPWVDKHSIHADRQLRQVRFTVKDRAAFDLDAVRETIARKGYKGVTLLTGPTES
jgi:copper chaperone CopZ